MTNDPETRDDAHDAFTAPTGSSKAADGRSPGIEGRGDRVGPWTLISKLGEGGFGTVWVAERREPFQQRVALKLIKPGMDSKAVLARFEQERQALAVMNHPGIARVVDGGLTANGRPYFAMEFVKGEPITDFCDHRRLALPGRLKLFMQACEAIQHAHLKGIVHRDLKPTNILAFESEGGEPRLKVIDFGVAKAMSQSLTSKTIYTETGQMIGTPEYMSPEQADPSNADIDTRSDIYSLGVLLYELAVGLTPFDGRTLRSKAYGEIQRTLREDDPPRPSERISTALRSDPGMTSRVEDTLGVRVTELVRTLRSEFEWIPMMAMRKEPHRRYQSATALGDDLRNYLAGRPILAMPESTGYIVRKYIRRHRAMATGVTAVVVALIAGLSIAAWQWRIAVTNAAHARQQQGIAEARATEAIEARDEATAQRGLAERNAANAELAARRAEKTLQFLEGVIMMASPNENPDPDLKVRDLFALLGDRIDADAIDDPAVQARLLFTIGETYYHLELVAEAELALQRSLEIRRANALPPDVFEGRILVTLADRMPNDGPEGEAARTMIRRGIEIFNGLGDEGAEWADFARGTLAYKDLLSAVGDDRQIDVFAGVIMQFLEPRPASLASTRQQLLESWSAVESMWAAGREDRAVARVRRDLDRCPRLLATESAKGMTIVAGQRFIDWSVENERLDLAEAWYRGLLDWASEHLPFNNRYLIFWKQLFGQFLFQHRDDFTEAESLLREVASWYQSQELTDSYAAVADLLADLHTRWHEAAPDRGHDIQAAEWTARSEAASGNDASE